MENKAVIQYEETLAVNDYNGDFDACKADVAKVREKLEALLEKMFEDSGKDSYNIVSIEFEEFDSTNPEHAMAYFLYTVEFNTHWCFIHLLDMVERAL